MIAWVEGVLREKEPTRVVVDVQGVGYELFITLPTFGELPDTGKTVALHVVTIVREDAITLFGFAGVRERLVFQLLLRASRVGPRLAQTILSGIAADRLVAGLRDGDVALLKSAPGVGAKLAERMVMDLRDRAAELAGLQGLDEAGRSGGAPRTDTAAEVAEQLLSTLINLDYPRAQAERVVTASMADAGDDVSIEELIRSALRRLAR